MPAIKLSVKHFPKGEKLSNIKKFFDGVKVSFIKMENHGSGYIEVKNEENAKKALEKNNVVYKKSPICVKICNQTEEKNDKKDLAVNKPYFPTVNEKELIEKIDDTGRLYIRNLSFDVTEADVVDLFKTFGELEEVNLPFDFNLKRNKAFGFVTFLYPKDAVKAFQALDKTKLKGRKIHILPGEEKPEGLKPKGIPENGNKEEKSSTFKEEKKEELKSSASSAHNWNALFINSDVVAQYLADKLNISKTDLFGGALKEGSISVKLAQAETQLVGLIHQYMLTNHIRLDLLEKLTNRGEKSKGDLKVSFALSSTTFIVKNLSPGVTKENLEEVFSKYSGLKEILLPPYGVTAIVTYELSQQAKIAYQNCAYMEFMDTVLMLQWAPLELFSKDNNDNKLSDNKISDNKVESIEIETSNEQLTKKEQRKKRKAEEAEKLENESKRAKLEIESIPKVAETIIQPMVKEDVGERSTRIIVKNISFQATLKELQELFQPFAGIAAIRMPKKPNGGHKGFAFIEFETEDQAQIVMDSMSISTHLLGRRLILLFSKVV